MRLGNTLPKDMTTLIAQLMQEESRLTNEKETAIAKEADAKMSTAHTTTTESKATSRKEAKAEVLDLIECVGVMSKRSQPFLFPISDQRRKVTSDVMPARSSIVRN